MRKQSKKPMFDGDLIYVVALTIVAFVGAWYLREPASMDVSQGVATLTLPVKS